MLKKYDIPLVLFYCYGIYALSMKALEFGLFIRFHITLWTSAYIFTGIVYLLAGLILTFFFSWKSILILLVSAFIQEYTWNIPYTFLHYDIESKNFANPFWIYYMLALAGLGSLILVLEKRRLRFNRLWIIFIAYYIFYLFLDMPITKPLSSFTFPNSIYEACYIILCLSATSRSFRQ